MDATQVLRSVGNLRSKAPTSLLDVVGIGLRLADLLGARVDLSEERTLKPRVEKNVAAETASAF